MGSHRVRHNWSDLAAAAAARGHGQIDPLPQHLPGQEPLPGPGTSADQSAPKVPPSAAPPHPHPPHTTSLLILASACSQNLSLKPSKCWLPAWCHTGPYFPTMDKYFYLTSWNTPQVFFMNHTLVSEYSGQQQEKLIRIVCSSSTEAYCMLGARDGRLKNSQAHCSTYYVGLRKTIWLISGNFLLESWRRVSLSWLKAQPWESLKAGVSTGQICCHSSCTTIFKNRSPSKAQEAAL